MTREYLNTKFRFKWLNILNILLCIYTGPLFADSNAYLVKINRVLVNAEEKCQLATELLDAGQISEAKSKLVAIDAQLDILGAAWKRQHPDTFYPVALNKLICKVKILLTSANASSGAIANVDQIVQAMLLDTSLVLSQSNQQLLQIFLAKGLTEQGRLQEASRVLKKYFGGMKHETVMGPGPFSPEDEQILFVFIDLLYRVGQYELLIKAINLAFQKGSTSSFLSSVFDLTLTWLESVPRRDLEEYLLQLKVEPTLFFRQGVPFNPHEKLAALYQGLKRHSLIHSGRRTIGDYMSEYHLRVAGHGRLANKIFKRDPEQIYQPLKDDSLGHFLFAYARLLSSLSIEPDGWEQHPYYTDMFIKYPDRFPGSSDFHDKLFSAAFTILNQQGNDRKTQLKALFYRLSLNKGIIIGSTNNWAIGPYHKLVQLARLNGDLSVAGRFALLAGDVMAELRSQNLAIGAYTKGSDKDIASRKPVMAFYLEAIEIFNELAWSIGTTNQRSSFYRETLTRAHEKAVGFLSNIGENEEAFYHVEGGKSRALLDTMRTNIKWPKPGRLIARLEEVDNHKRGIQIIEPFNKSYKNSRLIDDINTALERMATAEDKEETAGKLVTLRQAQQLLKENEVILEYYCGYHDIYAFLISRDYFLAKKVEVPLDLVSRLIFELRDKLNDQKDVKALGEELFSSLIGEWFTQLRQKDVVIIPHGILHYLPFQLLHNPDTDRYLVKDLNICYSPSLTIYCELTRRDDTGEGKRIVFADPVTGFSALQGARDEGMEVAQILNGQLFIGPKATETEFKDLAGKSSLIHLATHGVLNNKIPANSGILLTADNHNDGVLTLAEIAAFTNDTNLVVLSACETALGMDPRGMTAEAMEQAMIKFPPGDEVVGLSHAFLASGSRALVSSCWMVSDLSTKLLMGIFYDKMSKGMPFSESLRAAQLSLIESSKYSHPYYWASFIYIGPMYEQISIGHTSIGGRPR